MRRLWLLLCVFALSLAFASPVFADTSYVVQSGDTLTKIATRFNVTVDALVKANQLKNANAIRVGQTLIIPDGKPAPVPTTGSSGATSAPTPPTAPNGGPATYIVKPGDSVSRVATRFNITVDALMAANNLTTTTLQIGQTLIIPGATPASPAEGNSIYSRISGTQAFTRRIKTALDWLQAHDSDAYNRVNTYITTITPSPYAHLAQAIPMPGGGCLVRALARGGMTVEMTVALLYHEASHCYQFATRGLLSSKEAEVYAYNEQIAFMERHGFANEDLEYYRKIRDYYASQPDDGQYIPPPDF